MFFLSMKIALREKCPNTEVFLVRIFPHSDWILRISPYSVRLWENTDQKNLRIWALFTQCRFGLFGLYVEIKGRTCLLSFAFSECRTSKRIISSFLISCVTVSFGYFCEIKKVFNSSNRIIYDNDIGVFIQLYRKQPTGVFLGKNVLKICNKFTGEHSCQIAH